ncbi:hypothetical protein [Kitasatospora sp. NPDC056181]|uniref:hypothetical protein n=1 Tax=Kitasatospora sp. NPDC056181 TaxID=3345737 RepID=UPI0035E1A97B
MTTLSRSRPRPSGSRLPDRPGEGIAGNAARDRAYTAWTAWTTRTYTTRTYTTRTDAVLADHGAGDRFWLPTSRAADGSFHPDYDVHRVMWNNDLANPGRTTAKLFAAHAKAMTGASAG